jgi:hypothetical protein
LGGSINGRRVASGLLGKEMPSEGKVHGAARKKTCSTGMSISSEHGNGNGDFVFKFTYTNREIVKSCPHEPAHAKSLDPTRS